ncbi:GNAT family N-acetyltransferase [Flavobacteriaceae bacterium]|nr:GNAT family N-acetyltransferase [Flavobacteriaceae bacterium]
MKAHIRFAKITDSASILMLIQELAEFEKEPESVKLTLSDIENFGFGTQPLFQCLVAEINNQVVGMALFYSRFSTWKGPTFHLEDLIVSEASKGQGIGTQLYSRFIQIAYEKGVERIEWNVLDWNTPAVKFYEKSGATVLHEWCTVQMHRPEMDNYIKLHIK